MADTGATDVIIIKKYANRRLYDTSASSYVTLEHLSRLVREERDFVVHDAKTGEDITRSVLAQIIFEQENRNDGVLPISFLRQIIQFYGESVQSVLPSYLEMSMNAFVKQHEKWLEYVKKTREQGHQETPFEAQIRLNMEMFDDAMRMFAPNASQPPPPRHPPAAEPEPEPQTQPPRTKAAAPKGEKPAASTDQSAEENPSEEPLIALQRQMAEMQQQIERLANKK
ncbi:MAG: polyhydroxyalkanoate synthesis repressor PhaR [Hirschia sp.]|nr:polyhydroxyalkanoate synthesis repressor PhaR [Hirschia sp.]MBF17747.1 polyhydroxyalkanoate synthesis repressor PhaR [Hirschia sp.]